MQAIGEAIHEAGSQRAFCAKVNLSPATLSKWLSKSRVPGLDIIGEALDAYGYTFYYTRGGGGGQENGGEIKRLKEETARLRGMVDALNERLDRVEQRYWSGLVVLKKDRAG